MCSINFSTDKIQNNDYVNFFLQKRGPDNTSMFNRGNHTFVHNLLSMTGSFTPQPLSQDDQIYCLFNGEIYNFKELGDYDNDSKCIIPMYKKYGIEFPKYLDGEFAIVLVDYKDNIVLVTTDVFACKPLWLSTDGGIYISSYRSGIERQGKPKNHIEKIPANTTRVYSLKDNTKLHEGSVYNFELTQHKTNFTDWNTAFENAITKRAKTNVREGVFIGLSSGYDSGAIACELLKQKIDFHAYTLSGTENPVILAQRQHLVKHNRVKPKSGQVLGAAKQWIEQNVEEFYYQTWTMRSNYNERDLRLHDDNGSSGLSAICSMAKEDNKKIYLSGQGADEIFSDYGFGGHSKYSHSNFGGLFPEDLKTLFPWPSFYGSSMISYLAKDEYVGGGYGLECRFPFLDKYVVQEFLWLSCSLKNAKYKSPLYNYLSANNFPFAENEKIGF